MSLEAALNAGFSNDPLCESWTRTRARASVTSRRGASGTARIVCAAAALCFLQFDVPQLRLERVRARRPQQREVPGEEGASAAALHVDLRRARYAPHPASSRASP